MKGLLWKDLFLMRQYAKSLLLILVVFMLPAVFGKGAQAAGLMTGPVLLVFMMTGVTSMSYDKQAGWEKYALAAPVSRETIVAGKYVLTLIMAAVGILVSLLFNGALALVQAAVGGAPAAAPGETLLVHWFVFGIGLLFLSIILPLVFQFGPEKSRIFFLIFYLVPILLLLPIANIGMPQLQEAVVLRVLGLIPVAAAALFALSFCLSVTIFRKKEF